MNSDEILRQLNRLVNDKTIHHRARLVIETTINHIKRMGEEFEDITETNDLNKQNDNTRRSLMGFGPKDGS